MQCPAFTCDAPMGYAQGQYTLFGVACAPVKEILPQGRPLLRFSCEEIKQQAYKISLVAPILMGPCKEVHEHARYTCLVHAIAIPQMAALQRHLKAAWAALV